MINNRYVSKIRNSNTRKRKRILVFSTEGKNKTEKLYFKNFSNDYINIYFSKGGSTHPDGILSELITELKEIDFQPASLRR